MDKTKKAIIEEYWLKKLSGELPKITLPYVYYKNEKEEKTQEGNARFVSMDVPMAVSAKLKKTAKNSDIALFILLLTGLNIVLSKYTGSHDLVVGTTLPAANGDDNLVFCRESVSGHMTVKAFTARTKQAVLEGFNYAAPPYSPDAILKLLRNESNPGSLNIFYLAVILEPFQRRSKLLDRFESVLILSMHGEQLSLQLEYSSASFSHKGARGFLNNLNTVLDHMLKTPDREISLLDVVNSEEKRQVLYEFNHTEAQYPKNKTIHRLFEEQAEMNLDCLAISGARGSGGVSYGKLNEKANQLAHLLKLKGVTTGCIIGVMCHRSIESIIVMLAVLKSGSAFLPLDPDYPEPRKKFMIEDSRTEVLFIQKHLLAGNTFLVQLFSPGKILVAEDETIDRDETANLPIVQDDESIAYVIYTSGSTGKPKGVIVEHRSAVNYICWAVKKYVGKDNVNFPLFTSLSFDLTITSIFTPLLSGNSIIVYEGHRQESLLEQIIEENRVGVVKLTPAHLKLILEQNRGVLRSGSSQGKIKSAIKRFIVGGEALETKLAGEIGEIFRNAPVIYNEYGPTEAAVGCMIYKYSPQTDVRPAVPIGTGADNVQIYLLDENKRPVPVCAAGELYVSGDGVARGYLNRPELTEEKFIKNPFVPGKRMYKTGDLAQFLPDGNIEFVGRIDHQVKIRGFRIELGEIENELMEYKKHKSITLTAADSDPVIGEVKKLHRCTRCLLPANYPGIHFDNDGVCNACREFEKYEKDALTYFKNKEDFHRLVEEISKAGQGEYDCLLLFSGGKDSSYALYQLIDMGLKVLTFTFDNGYISDAAFKNIKRITSELGVENIVCNTKNMNKVFVESLNTNHNVCHGCWNALNTMGIKVAHEKGIDLVISGLSRGQIFEMRLEGLFQRGIFNEKEVEENLLLFRKTFHSKSNKFSRILDVELAEGVVEQIHFLDFFRYFDTPIAEIEDYLSKKGWTRPGDTGFCSSNCIINDVGIYVHLKEEGYHFYAAQLSWDIRLGSITREIGLKEIGFEGDLQQVNKILREIGYYHSPIKDAVVMVKKNENGDRYLAAYVVLEEDLAVLELREYLSKQLPDYMIPSSFVQVDRIPLTTNGKVDRAALDRLGEQLIPGNPYAPPRNKTEQKIWEVWKDTLHLNKIGIHDNYFDLGATSFDVIRLNRELKEVFQIDIPMVTMFRYTTIHSISNYLMNKQDAGIRDRADAFKRGKKDRMQQLQKRRRIPVNV